MDTSLVTCSSLNSKRCSSESEPPRFPPRSKFDADQLATSFETPCADAACADPYADALLEGLEAFVDSTRGAAFVDACHRHCDRTDPGHSVLDVNAAGTTPFTALAAWYDAGSPSLLLEQAPAATFPCDACC